MMQCLVNYFADQKFSLFLYAPIFPSQVCLNKILLFIELNILKLEKFCSSTSNRSFKDGEAAAALLEKLELWCLKRQSIVAKCVLIYIAQ